MDNAKQKAEPFKLWFAKVGSDHIDEKSMLLQDVFTKLDIAEHEVAEGKVKDARQSLNKLRQKHGI